MSGRVVIPIHDDSGQLVAYAGRAVDGSEPRYKLPAGFHKGQVLYNLHRVIAPEVEDGISKQASQGVAQSHAGGTPATYVFFVV